MRRNIHSYAQIQKKNNVSGMYCTTKNTNENQSKQY